MANLPTIDERIIGLRLRLRELARQRREAQLAGDPAWCGRVQSALGCTSDALEALQAQRRRSPPVRVGGAA